MNNDELIGMIIDFTHDLNDLCDRSTFGITVGQHGDKRVQITETSLFFDLFSTYELNKWNDGDGVYYGEAISTMDDVEFITVLTYEEFKQYIKSVVSSTNE